MRTTRSECEELRQLISDREFPTSRLSADLRARATSYTRRRSSEGAPQSAIAAELGVSTVSIARWLRSRDGAALVPVSVIPEPRSESASFEVVSPRGLRVVGLTLDDVCALLERHG